MAVPPVARKHLHRNGDSAGRGHLTTTRGSDPPRLGGAQRTLPSLMPRPPPSASAATSPSVVGRIGKVVQVLIQVLYQERCVRRCALPRPSCSLTRLLDSRRLPAAPADQPLHRASLTAPSTAAWHGGISHRHNQQLASGLDLCCSYSVPFYKNNRDAGDLGYL